MGPLVWPKRFPPCKGGAQRVISFVVVKQLGILTLLVVISIHTCGRIAYNYACTCVHIYTHTYK